DATMTGFLPLLLLSLTPSCLSIGKKVPVQFGRVCGFGDFNGDRNTDVLVQRGTNLTILLQDDELLNVLEEGVFTNSTSFNVGDDIVECSLGDFNGDTKLDVLVSTKKGSRYYHSVWISSPLGDSFAEHKLTVLSSQALAIDVDGDGWHDVLGFFENGSMYCATFSPTGTTPHDCSDLFVGFVRLDPYPKVPHLFVDLTGDNLAEIVFMDTTVSNGVKYLTPRMWGRFKNGWREAPTKINQIPGEHQFVGAPLAADFDADGLIELLVPICRKENCKQVTEFANWQYNRGWSTNAFDLQNFNILSDEDSLILFRVGDFSLDGYPDLVATLVEKQSLGQIKVIDNVLCTNCDRNGTRRFEINKSIFIQPKEVALGEIKMASFFDLKEDGNLDILIEYKPFEGETKFSFIPCDDKGDVTFLKVTVFTNVCDKHCKPSSKELGSGVSWGGACASFSMSDGWGGSLKSSACQIPAVTHRALAPPYVLFGLGRSPNFVDELTIGAPLYSDALNARQHTLKQIVPNSRIVVIPPKDGSQWLTRLYVTPSQLILQSLAVIALVCVMLLMVVAFLHYRERKEDRVERQQQSQRFHFDAM
uniref:T-cell immunomodulatory protein n=1 Tax=Haemonchus contortus TaxID=6289 RepID=A0A7I4YC98_HAECO